ncbi:response regulator [Geomonas agri]|uniref:response regulator n=1 Tax=Geomonas agri TaxID=2873702 RepID=UPI001CD2661B|nr:response regulator [Geomonas agri]
MPKTILTVDDSQSIRQMMRFTLSQQGYQVIEAADGVEALEKMKGASIDLVFTDLNMPRMDGLDLIRKLRAGGTNRNLPIVMLTTESQEVKKAEGKSAGATGWIVKPFRPEQLLQVTTRLLGS